MFVKHWIAMQPDSTITAGQARALAKLADGQSTTYAASGIIDVASVRISSGIADPSAIIAIAIAPSTGATKVVGTTAGSTAVVGAALSDSGCISITGLTSTGGTVRRYIKLFST